MTQPGTNQHQNGVAIWEGPNHTDVAVILLDDGKGAWGVFLCRKDNLHAIGIGKVHCYWRESVCEADEKRAIQVTILRTKSPEDY